jgi:hypothetical protein
MSASAAGRHGQRLRMRTEHTIDRLQTAALGRRIGDDHAKGPGVPRPLRREAGGGKPSDLVVYQAGRTRRQLVSRHRPDRPVPQRRRAQTVRPTGAGRRCGRTGPPYLRRRGGALRAPTRRGRCCPRAVHPRDGSRADRQRRQRARGLTPADCSRTRRPAPAGRWLAVEVEDLLKGRESGLEVNAVDLKAVLTKPAVEGILRGGYAGQCSVQVVRFEVDDGDVAAG